MDGITAATAAIAGKRAINHILQEVQNTASGALKLKIGKMRTATQIGHLYKNLSSIRKVKTIWHTEQAIDLFRFYHSSSIETSKGRLKIDTIDDFGGDNRIVLEGTVGQGKSMFLRYLCARELLIGKRVPLFVELRNIVETEELIQHICKLLDQYGFSNDSLLFNTLAIQSRIVLCLDGFDEIKESYRRNVIIEIEGLARKFPELIILITSRPDNAIDKSAFFRVLRLAPLRPIDVKPVVAKLTDDPKLTDDVMKAVSRSKTRVDQLLTTPLMVTLLVIAYKGEGRIPGTIAEFYESLFNTLFLRHDKLKPGYERVRTCGLNDRTFREVFDTMCFLVRQQQESTLKSDQMLKISMKASEVNQHSCDAQQFLDDVKKITCLLLEEGGSYHFIHKSVAEYHAASFVKGRPEEFAKNFYRKLLLEQRFASWSQDLIFLEQIDRYRYTKYFLLKEAEAIANCDRTEEKFIETICNRSTTILTSSFEKLTVGVNKAGALRSINYPEVDATKFWTLHGIFEHLVDLLIGKDLIEQRLRFGHSISTKKTDVPDDEILIFKADCFIKKPENELYILLTNSLKERIALLKEQVMSGQAYVAEKEAQEQSVLIEL